MPNFLNIDRLLSGLNQLNLDISDHQVAQLDAYASMLYKWNKTYNLTSITSVEDVLTHHILDSIATVPVFVDYLRDSSSLLDVGSGGGLPAIPLAIMFPHSFISMVDTVGKKAAFLTQVGVVLKLANIHVYHNRVEKLRGPIFDVISSRAFSSLSTFISLSDHLLKNNGTWIALKGQCPTNEIKNIETTFESKIVPLFVPYLNEERNIVVIKRKYLSNNKK